MSQLPSETISAYFTPDEFDLFETLLKYLLKLKFNDEPNVVKRDKVYYKRIADLVNYAVKTVKNWFNPSGQPKISRGNLSFFCENFISIQIHFENDIKEDTVYYDFLLEWIEPICSRMKWKNPLKSDLGLLNLLERKKNIQSKSPNLDVDLSEFQKDILHFYHSTMSIDGILYWSYTKIDFTKSNLKERELITTVKVPNYSRRLTIEYSIRLSKDHEKDNVLLVLDADKRKKSSMHSVFEDAPEHDNCLSGFMYHDDWSRKWRISPCLLAFAPLTDHKETGALPPQDCLKLQRLWNVIFDIKGKVVFEEYKLPKLTPRRKR